MPAGLRAKVLREFDDIFRLTNEWNDLFRRCPGATTFQRPEWVVTWLRWFRPTHPFFVAIWRESLLVGLAPLLIYEKDSKSVLAFAGGGVSDYMDALVDPSAADETRAAIFDVIASHAECWDQLELTDVPRRSILLQQSEVAIEKHDACPVLALPSSLDSLTTVVPLHKLRNYRNARRRLGEAGNIRIETASRANLDEAFSALFRLHTDRWARAGLPGMLSELDVQQFHLDLASQLVDKAVVRLYLLRLNEVIIAALYGLFEVETAYCYLQGFDPDYSKLSPGTAILGAVIEDAVRHGAGSIDFLRGREPYKYSWGACDAPTFRLEARSLSSDRSASPGHLQKDLRPFPSPVIRSAQHSSFEGRRTRNH